jgi:hypothetical protein
VIREEPGVLVDVIDDLLERVQRIRKQAQAFGRKPCPTSWSFRM